MQFFHYKEPNAIEPSADWRARIRHELETCDVFVALIGPGYRESDWCREEFAAARHRRDLDLLLYAVEPTDVGFAVQLHVAELPTDPQAATARMLSDIHKRLTRNLGNRPQRRPTLLGASREVIVDSIRMLPAADWDLFLGELTALGVILPESAAGSPIRPREVSDRVIGSVLRAEGDPSRSNTLINAVRALAMLAPAIHRPALGSILNRLRETRDNDQA